MSKYLVELPNNQQPQAFELYGDAMDAAFEAANKHPGYAAVVYQRYAVLKDSGEGVRAAHEDF